MIKYAWYIFGAYLLFKVVTFWNPSFDLSKVQSLDLSSVNSDVKNLRQEALDRIGNFSDSQKMDILLNKSFSEWSLKSENRKTLSEIYSYHFDSERVRQTLMSDDNFSSICVKNGVVLDEVPNYFNLDTSIFD